MLSFALSFSPFLILVFSQVLINNKLENRSSLKEGGKEKKEGEKKDGEKKNGEKKDGEKGEKKE